MKSKRMFVFCCLWAVFYFVGCGTSSNEAIQQDTSQYAPYNSGTPNTSSGTPYTSSENRKDTQNVPNQNPPTNPTPPTQSTIDAGVALETDGGLPKEKSPSDSAPAVNPWVETDQDNLSTFAIDVDTASYTFARGLILSGVLPSISDIRVEEFINFFDYQYAEPTKLPFQVHVDGAKHPFEVGKHILRVGIQGKRLDPNTRKSVHITLLVDTSCSMTSANKIGLVKKSLQVLTKNLKKGDTVAMATYAGSTKKVLEPTDASESQKILDAIQLLTTGGGTAMESGMTLAYEMASKSFVKGHENRVIVLSDGDANIGKTSHSDILANIEKYVLQGITMSTIGYGTGNYRSSKMEQLANKGNGNNYYIDSEKQAEKVFGTDLLSTLLVIAKDVKIQVEFSKTYVKKYRLVGYENRDIRDEDFRNDKVDAGELGSGHNVTAIYEVELNQPKVTELLSTPNPEKESLVTVRLRYKEPTASKEDAALEVFGYTPIQVLEQDFNNASWSLRWATAVMATAEKLRNSPYTKAWDWNKILQIANTASQKKEDHADFISIITKIISLQSVKTP